VRYRFGAFELDVREGRLTRGGELVELQPKVADALTLFVARAGALVSREELLEALWPGVHVSDDALQQVVRKLRRALGDDAIRTELKRGYRFVVAVTVDEVVAPAPVPTAAPAPAPAPEKRSRLWLLALLPIPAVAYVLLRPEPASPPALGACTPQRLTNTPEREQEGTFLDAAQSVVFVANDPAEGQYDLYVTSLRGEGRLRLTHTPGEESYPQASPDGDAILYTRHDDDGPALWEVAPTGGAAHLVVRGAIYGAWSPDGARVAYIRVTRDGPRFLAVRDRGADDAGERALGDVPADATAVAWSPDGKHLSYVDGHVAWIVPVSGGPPRTATPRAEYVRSCTWARRDALICDGNFLARSNLTWIPIDGAPRALTTGAGGAYHPARARDGTVLYTSEVRIQQLAVGDRPVRTRSSIECLDVDATGARVAFTDYDPPSGGSEAVVHRGGVDDVLGPGRCPRFAHHDARVIHLRDDGVWLDGARLGPALAPIAAPAWSPDDRTIAVATEVGLQTIDVATGAARVLAEGRFGRAAYDPTGARIAAARAGHLAIIDAATGAVTDTPIAASYENRAAWTADGFALLRDERHQPAIVTYTADGAEVSRAALPLAPSPSRWGVFEAVPFDGGWATLETSYLGDLFLLHNCVR